MHVLKCTIVSQIFTHMFIIYFNLIFYYVAIHLRLWILSQDMQYGSDKASQAC